MQIFSALDAISPSFSRTKLILFSPFRKGRTWKLCATGYLSMASTAFLPITLVYLAFIPFARQATVPYVVPLLLSITTITTLIYLVIYYLCSRLRFAFFDIVLNRGEFVAPAWRKYGSQSFKWMIFKVVLGCLFAAAIALPCVAYVRQMVAMFSSMNMVPGQPPSPEMMKAIFSGYAAFFVVYLFFGLYYWASSILSDFIVPSLALEDTTLSEAFRRLGLLIRNEPGQFTAYAFLKLGLALAAYVATTIAAYIIILIVGLVVGVIAFIGYLVLHALGVSSVVLIALGVILGVVLYLFFIFYLVFLGAGTVVTFLESYTLYFLGGRYPMLGDLLTASTPVPVTQSPLYPEPYPPYGGTPTPPYDPPSTPPSF